MTIASEIEDLNTNLTAAKNAVTAKGGTVGDTGLAGLATEIASIPAGGGGEVPSKYIDFYDYDGTRLYSWTEQELADATALPANPSHAGLTAQGWNWTLAELRDQGTPMDVGQMYTVTDGKTHLFVEVDADHLTPNLAIGLNGTATIDWGDGTSTTTLTGSSLTVGQSSFHTYTAAGAYEVTVDVAEGSEGNLRANYNLVSFLWKGVATQDTTVGVTAKNLAYGSQLKEVWVGDRMRMAYNSTAPFCYTGIERVMIPSGMTLDIVNNTTLMFSSCTNLKFVVLPRSITKLSSSAPYAGTFKDTLELMGISFPYGTTIVDGTSGTTSVRRFCLPNTVERSGFLGSDQLKNIYMADGITIFDGFWSPSLRSIKFPKTLTQGYLNYAPNTKIGSFPTWEYDYSEFTSVPSLAVSTPQSAGKLEGTIIKVPAALEAEWKATTNWSDWAAYIVGV